MSDLKLSATDNALSPIKRAKKHKKKLSKLKKTGVASLYSQSLDRFPDSKSLLVSNDKIDLALKLPASDDDRGGAEDEGSTFSLTSMSLGLYTGSDSMSVSSLNSPGSVVSSNTLGTEYSLRSHITSHELVAQIKSRVSRNLPPPEFVSNMSSMDPAMLSWNHRLPPVRDPENPPVNIVPCMVPLEVILAKADRRLRKIAKASKARKKQNDERVRNLEISLELKRTRAERYAAKLALQQLQCQWLRTLTIATYIRQLKPRLDAKLKVQKNWLFTIRAARIVQRVFFKWYYNEVKARLQRKCLHAFGRIQSAMKLHLRIFRKRLAVRKLKVFLSEFKGQHKMSVVVHRFLHSVRKIQRLMRDFLACKHAKVLAMVKIWDKIEHGYIRRKLEIRREKIANSMSAKKHLDKDLKQMNSSALEELKEKDRDWHKIHKQMQKIVMDLRSTGVIVDETEEDVITRMRVPEQTKFDMLRALLEKLRKQFYSDQKSIQKKKLEQDASFNEDHARNLLLGDGKEVMRLFKEKFDKKLVHLDYKPFMFFLTLERRMVYERVKEAHHIHETFKIKVDKFTTS